MPRIVSKVTTNLYEPKTKGFYIYHQQKSESRYLAQRKYNDGHSKCGLFYSMEDARAWLDLLLEDVVAVPAQWY